MKFSILSLIHPKSVQRLFPAWESAFAARDLKTYSALKGTAGGLKDLRLALLDRGVDAMLAWMVVWPAVTILVGVVIRVSGTTNPIWGLVAVITLLVLQPAGLSILAWLYPKPAMTEDARRDHAARVFIENAGSMPRAFGQLEEADDDLEDRDRFTGLMFNGLVLAAIINVSVNNPFVDAVFTLKVAEAWRVSYVGTLCLLAVPLLGLVRFALVIAPRTWVRLMRRHVRKLSAEAEG